MMPLPLDVGNIILKYLANFLNIDIWHRTSTIGYTNSEEYRIVRFLYTAQKTTFSECHIVPVVSNYSQFVLHRDVLQRNILFTVFSDEKSGIYEILDIFEKINIKNGNNQLLTMTSMDFNVIPSIVNRHFVNKKRSANRPMYSSPLKFNLTENITTAGTHAYMYKIDLGQFVNHSVIMNDDPMGPDDNIVSIGFFTKPCNKNAYIYLEA
jgi:hypothetical protein